jgi:predicted nucleic acid-binding protein
VTGPVFLDSGIFVAFLNRRDRWHPQARALFDGPKPKWSTSLLVVSEAYSWFLHRMGEESARNLRLLVDALPGLRVFEATAEHHKATTRVLDRFRGSKLTYVDASSLALIEQHKISRVWGTDHHLALTGRVVFPRL